MVVFSVRLLQKSGKLISRLHCGCVIPYFPAMNGKAGAALLNIATIDCIHNRASVSVVELHTRTYLGVRIALGLSFISNWLNSSAMICTAPLQRWYPVQASPKRLVGYSVSHHQSRPEINFFRPSCRNNPSNTLVHALQRKEFYHIRRQSIFLPLKCRAEWRGSV